MLLEERDRRIGIGRVARAMLGMIAAVKERILTRAMKRLKNEEKRGRFSDGIKSQSEKKGKFTI